MIGFGKLRSYLPLPLSPMMMIVVALLVSRLALGQVTLENWPSTRNNGQRTPLFSAYLGEDPGQEYNISKGQFHITGSDSNRYRCPNRCGVYWQFLSQGTNGYSWKFPCDPSTSDCGYLQHWIESGTWSTSYNRMYWMARCSRDVSKTKTGYGNVQVGTYIRNKESGDAAQQGVHYYHHFDGNYTANRWVFFVMNMAPTHRVGQTPSHNWPDDPQFTLGAMHYFDGMTRFYFDTQPVTPDDWDHSIQCDFGPIRLKYVTGEPDEYVRSVQATYNGSGYEVDWGGPKNDTSTFEVRYSTSSMHVNGFSSGIEGAAAVAATGNDYTIVGTTFTAPEAPVMYIAIRPTIAVIGASNTTPIQIKTNVNTLFSDGDQVTISGVRSNTAANGTWHLKNLGVRLNSDNSVDYARFEIYSDSQLTQPAVGNGIYTAGGSIVATSDTANFTEIAVPRDGSDTLSR